MAQLGKGQEGARQQLVTEGISSGESVCTCRDALWYLKGEGMNLGVG